MSTVKKKKFDIKVFILIALPLSILILILILPELNIQSDLEKNIIEPYLNTVIDGDYEIENIAENMHPVSGVSGDVYDVYISEDGSRGAYQVIIEDDKVVSFKRKEGY
ncbi:hypothetical protein GH741_03650 [Aquibacillus halophilus]|uniref:Uncharacterized protein n=1 Tax=Aquibacillus halophilus TaxID=930132 RepID=A0A6A8DFX7_9BACI|nr:hypothetical protein [Aquibacillus halophilus]MRH41767.1 hypothetical protein [Aquibacillus halophilus]